MAQCFQSAVAVLKISLCLPLMLAISPPLLAEVNPELIAYKIREECRSYSDILAKAKWTFLTSKTSALDISEKEHLYQVLRKMQFEQCVITSQISILNELRHNVSPDEWQKIGGDKKTIGLTEMLYKSVSAPLGF